MDWYKEDHFQCSTENQHIFFLKSELYKFEVHDLFLDGTFHLVKNQSEYCQIYIISILYSENNGTFSYPICFSLMRNKFTSTYSELFNVINHNFYEQFGRELSPTVFRIDCESAVVRSIKEVYGPSAKIGLDQTVPNFDDTVHYTQL